MEQILFPLASKYSYVQRQGISLRKVLFFVSKHVIPSAAVHQTMSNKGQFKTDVTSQFDKIKQVGQHFGNNENQ